MTVISFPPTVAECHLTPLTDTELILTSESHYYMSASKTCSFIKGKGDMEMPFSCMEHAIGF